MKKSSGIGPQTRAQLKKQESETSRLQSINKGRSTKHRAKDSKDDKENNGNTKKSTGWTSIQDVEAKLRTLQIQYTNAKDEKTKKRVGILIDKYEKQAKALNLEIVKKDIEKKKNT